MDETPPSRPCARCKEPTDAKGFLPLCQPCLDIISRELSEGMFLG